MVRNARMLLGLSQDQLARRAATSQGTISRMEAGHHLDLPIVSIARVVGVLAAALPGISDALPRSHTALFAFGRAFPTASQPTNSLPPDPALRRLLRAYHALSPPRRALFIEIVLPLATHLAAIPWRPDPTNVPPPVTDGLEKSSG